MGTPPSRIDKYELIRRLGIGGMGTVYLARDPDLHRDVAIKLVRDPLVDEELLERFMREARAAAKLRHDNIITIYQVGRCDQQPFIAMEYVDGSSLADLIARREPLTLSEKLSYLEQLCAGLHYAHCQGLVHRDIKPANVMVDARNVIRILDFGIARVEGSEMTQVGDVMGTLAYMSPEQLRGEEVDFRSDIFAVGAVAYELLAYEQAFGGRMVNRVPQRRAHRDLPPLSTLCPGLPPGLEQTVLRALAEDPDERFSDLGEARAALREIRRSIEPDLTLEPNRSAANRKGATPTPTPARLERQLRVRQHLAEADRRIAAGDLTGAAQLVEQAVALDPSNPSVVALGTRLQQAVGTIVAPRLLPNPSGAVSATPVVSSTDWRRRPTVIGSAVVLAIAAILTASWLLRGRAPESVARPPVETPAPVTPAPPPPKDTTAGADAPPPSSSPSPPAKPAAASEDLVTINDIYLSGDIERALQRIEPLVRDTNDDRVLGLARRIAQGAQTSMTSAERAAASRRAEEVARDAFDAAIRAKVLSQRAMARNDYVEAGRRALIAAAAFKRAEQDALAAPPTIVAKPVTAPPVDTQPSPDPPPKNVPASNPEKSVAPIDPTPIAPKQEPPPSSPPPPSPRPEEPLIFRALNQYQAAYRNRSVKELREVYPNLPREMGQRLQRAFDRDCRDYDVTFGNIQPAFNPADPTYATVTVRTIYTCQPKTAQAAQPQTLQDVFVLRKVGDAWLIDSLASTVTR